ncbi:MAG: glycosyltransferase, partial [Mariprofundaceae bacterium]|nr:glycosyltransferase [Mariprofundaceae bacterium]
MSNRLKETIGIIISTYNSIDNLSLVIEGYRNQTDLNFILYIADDGSDSKTAAFIKKKSANFPVPIQHIWHEDLGFRLSAIRNRAIHQAKTSYLIITDGDCIPFPGLVAAHRSNARPGSFVTGGRLLLSEKLSHHLRTAPWPIQQEPLSTLIKRVIKGEINRITPLILPIFCTGGTTKLRGLRGCHLAFWRKDLLQVDGFDESYKGWGREDSDIACRLFHTGITRRTLRGIPLLHLWHAEATRSSLDNNDALLAACIHEKRIIARQGISSHSKQEASLPHDDKKHQQQKTISNQLTIVQICRRFGPVGGMERYVWELCRELVSMGHQVHVLCEVNLCTEPLSNVSIHELGTVRPKPRWLAHIRFSRRVHHWLKQHRTPEMIIHSHERTQDHHISTFHGPPFAKVRDFPLWKRISLRIKMNLWLEQRELCATQVQMIVPNSIHIANDLRHYYPST